MQRHKKDLPKLAVAICRLIYVGGAAEHRVGCNGGKISDVPLAVCPC